MALDFQELKVMTSGRATCLNTFSLGAENLQVDRCCFGIGEFLPFHSAKIVI